jgi:hypothetical protein
MYFKVIKLPLHIVLQDIITFFMIKQLEWLRFQIGKSKFLTTEKRITSEQHTLNYDLFRH